MIVPTKPKILVLPTPSLYRQLFTPEVRDELGNIGELTLNQEERNWNSAELAGKIAEYDAVITGWGTPVFTDEVLHAANRLRLIAHSAGSIKRMLPPAVFNQGIAVTHAAIAIAPAVAEMNLLLIMLCLRNVHRLDRALKAGEPWSTAKALDGGQELAGQRIGIIGAGYTGRCLIGLLHALQVEVWVHDPYFTEMRAAELGVHKAELADLMSNCPIVTMQAPPTQETYHMIGARELKLLKDGAMFINTARAHTVDQGALLAELQSGRIQGALDVFDQEPLPSDSPFLSLENVIVTPHVAGITVQAKQRQGQLIMTEIKSFFADETLNCEVRGEMLDTMA